MSPNHRKYYVLFGTFLIVLTTIGCQSLGLTNSQKFGTPNFKQPGTAEAQQNRAVRFDPYPETNVGPETEGMRPRGYSKPLAEILRARWKIVD